jgi:hypothetical protein
VRTALSGTSSDGLRIRWRSVRHSTPRLTSRISPVTICGIEQAKSVSSIAFSTTRSLISVADQAGKAADAARTAASTSRPDETGTREMTLPSLGSRTSRYESASPTNAPPR